MIGRQCDTPAAGTYCVGLQFFTYEAELARIEEKVCLSNSHSILISNHFRKQLYLHMIIQMNNVHGQVQVLYEFMKEELLNLIYIIWLVVVFII
jgi:hypothetical protein